MTMQITVNGDFKNVEDNISVAGLVELLELTNKRLAVEVNEDIIPRSQYEECRLKPDDKVEIVHAIGGGRAD